MLCLPSPQKLQECSELMPCCTGFPEGSTAPGVTGTKGILVKNTGELFKSNDEMLGTHRGDLPKAFSCAIFPVKQKSS